MFWRHSYVCAILQDPRLRPRPRHMCVRPRPRPPIRWDDYYGVQFLDKRKCYKGGKKKNLAGTLDRRPTTLPLEAAQRIPFQFPPSQVGR